MKVFCLRSTTLHTILHLAEVKCRWEYWALIQWGLWGQRPTDSAMTAGAWPSSWQLRGVWGWTGCSLCVRQEVGQQVYLIHFPLCWEEESFASACWNTERITKTCLQTGIKIMTGRNPKKILDDNVTVWTHLSELPACSLVFISWHGRPLLQPPSGPLWMCSTSSESSLKRSFWARYLQSALHPGLVPSLPRQQTVSWELGALWGPGPEAWTEALPFSLSLRAVRGKGTKAAEDAPGSMFTMGGRALAVTGFTGSIASSTCSISSSRANVDSPSGNVAPKP